MGGARAFRAERWVGRHAGGTGPAILAALLAFGSVGCGDPTGPDGNGEYKLVSIAGVSLPASFTDGTCTEASCGLFEQCRTYPDQKYVKGGSLTLGGGQFEIEYSWVGETPECCFWGPRKGPTWSRTARGSYSGSGSQLTLSGSDQTLTAVRAGSAIVVDSWGGLRQLRYAPK